MRCNPQLKIHIEYDYGERKRLRNQWIFPAKSGFRKTEFYFEHWWLDERLFLFR